MKPLLGGLLSGLILGLFLKIIQSITGLKVYTLLLNVDYIPILNTMRLTEIAEFWLHLVISILLAYGVNFYITKKDSQKETILQIAKKVSLIAGLLLYPTTLLSDRTPLITSGYAFTIWMLGHWLYGLVLGRVLSIGKK